MLLAYIWEMLSFHKLIPYELSNFKSIYSVWHVPLHHDVMGISKSEQHVKTHILSSDR